MIAEHDLTRSGAPGACTVVIVNWNSDDHLRQCLQSIPECYQVVVVDNASTDESLARALSSAGPAVVVEAKEVNGLAESEPHGDSPGMKNARLLFLRQSSNRGFAGAANAGAARSTRDYLLFLNPDIRFADKNSPQAMVDALQKEPEAAAASGLLKPLGPSPGTSGGGSASLIRPLPTLASALSDVLFWDEILRKPEQALPEEGEIEQAPGACLLVRRSIFETLGGFDERFYPAWFEDVDLCKRINDRGLKILYQPRSVFYHQGGYSAAKLSRRQFHRIYYGNMSRYFEKHYGRAAAAILKTAMLVGNLVRGFLK